MMLDELLLLSKSEIPFTEARLTIHNPTLNEIGFINEESFHMGVRFLNFSADSFIDKDKSGLNDKSDFEIFMMIINDKSQRKFKVNVLFVLTLLFPDYQILISDEKIILKRENFETSINNLNFESFKEILSDMFCLVEIQGGTKYNPKDKLAKKIADKINKGQQKRNQLKGSDINGKLSLFSRYVSILSVGLKIDINILMNYTVYQLNDQFKRFRLKQGFDTYFKLKLAGAQDLEEVEDWMDDIHPD